MNELAKLSTILLLIAGLACTSGFDPGPAAADDPALSSFLDEIEVSLENHRWERILADADPEHYETQVEDLGMPEPQYVAELFGLHSVDNNIESGERPSWEDLEQIESVSWTAVDRANDRIHVRGTATLRDGSELDLHTVLVWIDEELWLTGGLG
ncbi:MAG: hypothetical protein R3338_05970 [Thermoanaerobaculia bacterium]|nr:hypothetical protein [Thermoanaerobaculia bacterium]